MGVQVADWGLHHNLRPRGQTTTKPPVGHTTARARLVRRLVARKYFLR